MAIEIERKFLVRGTAWKSSNGTHFRQGYLSGDPSRTIRVRIAGTHAWLTIKGISDGPSRSEFEYGIPYDDAEQLLQLCEKPLIQKIRYRVEFAGKRWEVDEFLGQNQGLVIAEIELGSVDEDFELPTWVGQEVTNDARYFNSMLLQNPFCDWS